MEINSILAVNKNNCIYVLNYIWTFDLGSRGEIQNDQRGYESAGVVVGNCTNLLACPYLPLAAQTSQVLLWGQETGLIDVHGLTDQFGDVWNIRKQIML